MAYGKVNATGVSAGGFSVIPEGMYTCKIIEVVDSVTANFDPKFSVKLLITSGNFAGKWIWDNIIISDNPASPGHRILGRSLHFLHCISEPYKDEFEYDTNKWIDKIVEVKVFQDEYQGKKIAKVAEYILKEDGNKDFTPKETPKPAEELVSDDSFMDEPAL